MCKHVRTAFDVLLNKFGQDVFLKYRNWDAEKNNLLQPYGITLTDADAKYFKFTVTYSGLLQMETPAGYIKAGDKEELKKLHLSLKGQNSFTGQALLRPALPPGTIIDFEIGFVLNFNSQRLQLGFELEPAKVYNKNNRTDIKKLALNNAASIPLLKGINDELYNLLYQLRDERLVEYLKTKGFGHVSHYSNPWNNLGDAARQALKQHYIKCLQQIWPYLVENSNTFLLKEGKFSSANCKSVHISKEQVELSFEITTDEKLSASGFVRLSMAKQ